ncbi:hypothetical protein [Thalassomonas sp. RHCl1]|nr:hypothetical protein [Thalassomonas sp. RHCl1]
MTSLLTVCITAPYGDKGIFPTLERVIEHYSNVRSSSQKFYDEHEACQK